MRRIQKKLFAGISAQKFKCFVEQLVAHNSQYFLLGDQHTNHLIREVMADVTNSTIDCVDPGDTAWVATATILVLGMLPGLALFEAGLLRSKNTVSITLQVMGGLSVLSTMWFLFGFSLTFGPSQVRYSL